MPSVLFICTANQIRSPLAEAIMRKEIVNRGYPVDAWKISSAGTWAKPGLSVFTYAQIAAKELGVDLESHRSQIVTEELLADHALVLTMEQGHKEALQVEFPRFAGKIYLLSEMVNQHYDIHDPVGLSFPEYWQVGKTIESILQDGMMKIVLLASETY